MIIPMLALALLAPADTPIEPIPVSLIEAGIETGVFDETCDLYASVIPILTDAMGGDILLAMDIVDAYVIWSIEEGWEPAGSALTLEARETYTDFLHECAMA